MKVSNRLIYAFCVLTLPLLLSGQTFTIGTFDGQNTSTTYPTPYGDNRESTRAQYLYLASELSAAGATAGNITKLGFFVEDVAGAGVHENHTIKLQQTVITTIVGWELGGVTVHGPVDYTPVAGLNEHLVSAPFYWDGVSNLIVEVCHHPTVTMGVTSTENAVVQLSTGLLFNGSRTRSNNNDLDICNTTQADGNMNPTSRPVLSLTFCYPPVYLTVNGVTSISADLSWSPPALGAPGGYDWTYGEAGYVPGVSGTELGSGSTTGTAVTLGGLSGLTTYAFWVRSDCGDGYSRWAGPLEFLTDPSCNDLFTDSGGFLFPYDTNENYVKVFCPDVADNALTMSFFLPLSMGSGDTLRIYNGDNTGAPLFAALTGVVAVPPVFTTTTASGCMTVHFTSDSITSMNDIGWAAGLFCAGLPADSCYEVLELDINNITSSSADISWLKMFGAESYEWELLELPAATLVAQDPAYSDNSLNLNMLESGTSYQFNVRTNCINGEHSDWLTVFFTTPVNCNGPVIQCLATNQVSAEKTGQWNSLDCGVANPGKERVFQFVPPNTATYKLEVTSASGGFVSYFYKAASGGCNEENWHCIDDFNAPGNSALPPVPNATLSAGVLYYILCDPQTTGPVLQSFRITECGPPSNDSPINAIDIQVNTPCEDNIYSNIGAGLDPGEPDPDVDDTDGLVGRWLDAADETVWFKFLAPPSGTITIFTNPEGGLIPNDDTQVALYEVDDPTNFATYKLLVSDEDNGVAYLGYNSVVSYTGLQSGQAYYIQVDGWGVNSGAFCIAVLETVETASNANCDADYTLTDVSGDSWFGIYATPDDLDIGPLVAAINPNDYDLGTVVCRVQTYDNIPVSANGIPYMPAYYYFTSSLAPAGEVLLRLFYSDPQLDDLKIAANEPDNGIEDLVVSRFNGVIADCEQLNNSGASVVLPVDFPTQLAGTFFLEFYTDMLGEFGAHFGLVPLPLKLNYFTGKVQDRSNRLEWQTLQEKNVQWHIVERSPDGVKWSETGRQAGQLNSDIPLTYFLDDNQPLAKAYYRLRSVDFDGTASVSQAIALTRKTEEFGITGIFPSPTSGQISVQFAGIQEEAVLIRATDITGRVLLEQATVAARGINTSVLSLGDLPAGVYCITVAGSASVSAPVRVVKQ